MTSSDNLLSTEDTVIISNKHLRLLDNIFRIHHLPNNSSDLEKQIIKWAELFYRKKEKNGQKAKPF